MWKSIGIALCAAVLLSSCGKPDVSGIYLATSDRMVSLVQIVENKDGALTGRLEQVSIKPDGTVKDETIPLDGAASGHDLVFKPASVWLGGLQASGTLSGDQLTLTGAGFTINAVASSLENYQTAVARVQALAASDRQHIADLQQIRARMAAQAQAVNDAISKNQVIERSEQQLRDDTAKLNAAIADCPDFHQQAAANTTRVARMAEVSMGLSGVKRSQMAVAANQVQIATNQIEIARSQYAIGLNQIVQDATPIVSELHQLCDGPQNAQFAQPCGAATGAAAAFAGSLVQGRTVFNGYKQAVKDELDRQSALIRQMNG